MSEAQADELLDQLLEEIDLDQLSGEGTATLSPLSGFDLLGQVGPLRASDIERYREVGPDRPTARSISRVSARHHRIAQLVAVGLKYEEIARAVKLTPQYIGNLVRSPAVQALVEHYVEKNSDATSAFQLEMLTVAGKALDVVSEDLGGGLLRGKDAVAALVALADRTGHGPASSTTVAVKSVERKELSVFLEVHDAQRARVISEPIDIDARRSKEIEAADTGTGVGNTCRPAALPAGNDEGDVATASSGPAVRAPSRQAFDPVDALHRLRASDGALD